MIRFRLLIGVCMYCGIPAIAQRSIAIIGSSTVAGKGATTGHAWVQLTSQYLKSLGLIDTIYNLGLSGTLTWDGLPTGSPHPDGSDSANPQRNVTKALSFVPTPKLIIVSYPNNDIHDGWTITQYLGNLRLIYQTVRDAGVACIITTTQPRDGMSPALRKVAYDAADSIALEYPQSYFDFYDTLVDRYSTPDTLNIKAAYEYGDGIHVNDSGHLALFNMAKSYQALTAPFITNPLALDLTSFEAKQVSNSEILLQWTATGSDGSEQFAIQRSSDGTNFSDIGKESAAASSLSEDYSWLDEHPASGQNFYRLHLTGTGTDRYSGIVSCQLGGKGLQIVSVYSTGVGGTAEVSVSTDKDGMADLTVFDMAGTPVLKNRLTLTAPSSRASLAVQGLAKGVYIVQVRDDAGRTTAYRFLRL